jgi:hypothetical protein
MRPNPHTSQLTTDELLGLEVCATAGFIDEEFDRALEVDGLDVATMLIILLGMPALVR